VLAAGPEGDLVLDAQLVAAGVEAEAAALVGAFLAGVIELHAEPVAVGEDQRVIDVEPADLQLLVVGVAPVAGPLDIAPAQPDLGGARPGDDQRRDAGLGLQLAQRGQEPPRDALFEPPGVGVQRHGLVLQGIHGHVVFVKEAVVALRPLVTVDVLDEPRLFESEPQVRVVAQQVRIVHIAVERHPDDLAQPQVAVAMHGVGPCETPRNVRCGCSYSPSMPTYRSEGRR
jgi:hypothetical protein